MTQGRSFAADELHSLLQRLREGPRPGACRAPDRVADLASGSAHRGGDALPGIERVVTQVAQPAAHGPAGGFREPARRARRVRGGVRDGGGRLVERIARDVLQPAEEPEVRPVAFRAEVIEELHRPGQRVRAARLQEVRGEVRDRQSVRPLRPLQQVVQRTARCDVRGEVAAAVRVERLPERARRPAPVQPRLGALGDLPPPILGMDRDLVERRAGRRLLQRAEQLVQLAGVRVRRLVAAVPAKRAADSAVLPQRPQASSARAAEATQVGARDRLANAGESHGPQAPLRALQRRMRLGPAQLGGKLARRGVAQQGLDPRMQLPQRLQLLLAQGDRGWLGKRAALVERLRPGRLLRLAGEARERRPALFEQRPEGLQGRGAPAGGREVAHLREEPAHLARSVGQLRGASLALEPRQDAVHARQVLAQLAGARIGQRSVVGRGEAAEGLLEPLGDPDAEVSIALDDRVETRRGGPQQAARRQQLRQGDDDRGQRARRMARPVPARRAQVIVPQARIPIEGTLALVLHRAEPRALLGMHPTRVARLREPGRGAVDGVLAGRQEPQQLVAPRAGQRRDVVRQVAPRSGALVQVRGHVERRGAALQVLEAPLDALHVLARGSVALQVRPRLAQRRSQPGGRLDPGLQEGAEPVPPALLLHAAVERRVL